MPELSLIVEDIVIGAVGLAQDHIRRNFVPFRDEVGQDVLSLCFRDMIVFCVPAEVTKAPEPESGASYRVLVHCRALYEAVFVHPRPCCVGVN